VLLRPIAAFIPLDLARYARRDDIMAALLRFTQGVVSECFVAAWTGIEMNAGLVSVIVPTYNRANCLAQAVESVFAQTYGDVEVLLIDDGSTDDTPGLVERRWGAEPRLRYLRQENRGVSAARNLGLRSARGAYIALLDSDDSWMPWKLEAQLACLAAFPDAGMVWTDMQATDPDGRIVDPRYLRTMYHAYRWFTPEHLFRTTRPLAQILNPVPDALRTATVRYGDIFSPMLMGNLVHTSTVLLRRTRLEQVGTFDESMRTGEDYDFHLRTCRAGPVAFLDAPAICYQRGRPDQLTRPEFALQIGRNFLRTIEPVIERDRTRIFLPDWMIARSLADGHAWVGEAALSAGLHAEARRHLVASLRAHPWQPRVAVLLAGALLPPAATRALRKGLMQVKRALRAVPA
jgi:GT2 family glycosyltransferase